MHRTCLQTAAGPGLSAPATSPWRDNGRGSDAGLGRASGVGACAKADERQRGLVDQMLREKDEAARQKEELARENSALEVELAGARHTVPLHVD